MGARLEAAQIEAFLCEEPLLHEGKIIRKGKASYMLKKGFDSRNEVAQPRRILCSYDSLLSESDIKGTRRREGMRNRTFFGFGKSSSIVYEAKGNEGMKAEGKRSVSRH